MREFTGEGRGVQGMGHAQKRKSAFKAKKTNRVLFGGAGGSRRERIARRGPLYQ